MKKKIIKNGIYLLIGVIIGFVISLLIGAMMSHYVPDALTERPKIFGDAKICAITPDEEDSDIGKMLLMTRNEAPFFYAKTNKDGQITSIAVTDKDTSRFCLETSIISGKWKIATYGRDKGHLTGEVYKDGNFDGQFDIKSLYNENGERLARHIYIGDGIWKEAQHIERQMAAVGDKYYVFSDDFGWQLSDK